MTPSASFGPLYAAVIALFGVLVAQAVLLWQAARSDRRWRREEALRMLRWAAELAVTPETGRSALGLVVLGSLDSTRLADPEDQVLLSAVLERLFMEGETDDPEYAEEPVEGEHDDPEEQT